MGNVLPHLTRDGGSKVIAVETVLDKVLDTHVYLPLLNSWC